MMTVAAVLMMSTIGSLISVFSPNMKLSLEIDSNSGEIHSLQGVKVIGTTVLGNCASRLTSIKTITQNVIVNKEYQCGVNTVNSVETFGQTDDTLENEILWKVTIQNASGVNWSTEIMTSLQFDNSNSMRVWLPWNKPNSSGWNDPLLLESWSNCVYNTGALIDGSVGDTVVAEHSMFVLNKSKIGISLISDPSNYPHHGKVTTTSLGKIIYQRSNALFRNNLTHSFVMHFSLHGPSIRDSLSQSIGKYKDYWNPINSKEQSFTYDGMGSYTWVNNVPENMTLLNEMNYKVNWDLSGRFFPYMGMYLPPVSSSDTWENDPEGTQNHINVTFEFIDKQYLKQKRIGAVPLSYFNIFEYGGNVTYDINQTKPTGHGDWKNASDYLKGYLRDSLVTDYTCYAGGACKGGGIRMHGAAHSWQGAVVVDPAIDSYNNFLMEQATRKLKHLKQFTGIVIDRSDWCQLYSHNTATPETAVSFVNNATATNFAGSWVSITRQLRKILGNDKTILYNTVGFASLSLLRYTDGTFSEGRQVNAAGLLGITSPSILWTYDATECCASQQIADLYFQSRLYMRVFPMAPYPGNDHSIPPGDVQNFYYLKYGAMFRALNYVSWELDERNLIKATGFTINTFSNETHMVAVIINSQMSTITPSFPCSSNKQYLLPGSTENWTDVNLTIPLKDGCVMVRVSCNK